MSGTLYTLPERTSQDELPPQLTPLPSQQELFTGEAPAAPSQPPEQGSAAIDPYAPARRTDESFPPPSIAWMLRTEQWRALRAMLDAERDLNLPDIFQAAVALLLARKARN